MKERKMKNPTKDSTNFCSSSSKTVRQNLASKLKTKALMIKRQKENEPVIRIDNKDNAHIKPLDAKVNLKKNYRRRATTISSRQKRIETKKRKSKPIASEETDSDDDAERHQQVYSATYVEDFMEYSETVGDQTARYITEMRQNHSEYEGLIRLLDDAMDDLLKDIGSQTQRLAGGTNKLAVLNVENLLLLAKQVGDNGVTVSEMALHSINDKLHNLILDEKNMIHSMSKSTNTPKKLPEKFPSTDNNPTYNRPKKASFEIHRKKPSILSPMTKLSDPLDEMLTLNTELSRSCPSPSYSVASSLGCKSIGSDDKCSDSIRYRTCRIQNPPQYAPFPRVPRTPPKMALHIERKDSRTRYKNTSRKKSPESPSSKLLDESHLSDAGSSTDSDQPTYCICDQESFGKMVGCDNDLCPIEWFHFKCVGLKTKPKGDWYCPKCRGDNDSSMMKPKDVFLQELEEYNKQKERESMI